MAFPLVPLAMGMMAGGHALSGYYSISKAMENRSYWDAYQRNTRRKVLYPFRVGYNDIYNAVGSTLTRSTGSLYGMYRFSPYWPSRKNNYDIMFG